MYEDRREPARLLARAVATATTAAAERIDIAAHWDGHGIGVVRALMP
jgi:hypothetical protein